MFWLRELSREQPCKMYPITIRLVRLLFACVIKLEGEVGRLQPLRYS